MTSKTLHRRDWALLVAYSFALFGVSLVGGRPLTLHESVLPQSAREMLADGDWIVPKKGGEPWLESPPLPQWCTVAIASLFGRCDAEWIPRLGPVLVAMFCVCLTAWMASVWYGRTIGLISGLIFATTCEFTRYAWLAEDEIYLCGLVTAAIFWFVKLEFTEREFSKCEQWRRNVSQSPNLPRRIFSVLFGRRPWSVVIFFALMGLTNLAKGLIFGTAMAAIPMIGWLAWNRDWTRVPKYVWVWGFVLFGGILAAWPLAAQWRNPDVVDVWVYDLGGRVSGEYTDINQPLWYYAVNLPWMLAPWTFVLPFGLAATWNAVKSDRNSPARFLWAWAFLVPIVFSIPGGKHHHYLLHALAPWAILSALGLGRCRAWLASWPRWLVHPAMGALTVGLPAMIVLAIVHSRHPLPGPPGVFLGLMVALPFAAAALTWGLHHAQPRVAAVTAFASLLVAYGVGHWYAGQYVDVHRMDVALLKEARQVAEQRQAAIVVDLNQSPLSGFLDLFYLPPTARSIHNISFLADESLPKNLLLLTRIGEADALRRFGEIEELARSQRRLKSVHEPWRLALYAVRLNDHLDRKSAHGVRVSPMQAMHRADGPILR
jgi:4-amino-4-deoxy-L-arabinose transferase-like glycosyltransferase